MATIIIYIFGELLHDIPERRHKVNGSNSFAFCDLKNIIAQAARSDDFNVVYNKTQKPPENLWRMPFCGCLRNQSMHNFGET
jgi:hypothetical protein